MMQSRKSGVLLHISSLPSKHGVGDLGKEAYNFIDELVENGFKIWQILPLGPVGPGNSPYQAFSAYAGEPIFISLELLLEWKLLREDDLLNIPRFKSDKVEYTLVRKFKESLLKKAWKNFQQNADQGFHEEFHHFQQEHNWWLTDYALYKVCQTKFEGEPWNKWDKALAKRDKPALQNALDQYAPEVIYEKFVQFLFFRQWFKLKTYANSKGIQVFGDVPLYVAHDSADVWGNQHLFILDENGEPELLGGVPPDYFSLDGQLWGNPVFNWDALKQTEYQWWMSRMYFNFHMFNFVRIDHFRGLESFWAVKKGELTAINGEWKQAFGHEMLALLQKQLGPLPVVAEDLGIITPEVEMLRDSFHLPGMKVLQFAYASDVSNVHLPHNYTGRNIVYTGTHDNNTLIGWLNDLTKEEAENLNLYYEKADSDINARLIELAWSSTAEIAIVPMQDILCLDGMARMNTPGTASGNWTWRYKKSLNKSRYWKFFKKLNSIYNRYNG